MGATLIDADKHDKLIGGFRDLYERGYSAQDQSYFQYFVHL